MTESKPRASLAPAGLMFLAITSVGWGFNWPVTKYLLGELPPLTLRGSTVRVAARHGAPKEPAAKAAADPGRQLADRARLLPGGAGGACDRDHASRSRDRPRLVASGLFDRDPVLHRLCQLVCGAVAPACIR